MSTHAGDDGKWRQDLWRGRGQAGASTNSAFAPPCGIGDSTITDASIRCASVEWAAPRRAVILLLRRKPPSKSAPHYHTRSLFEPPCGGALSCAAPDAPRLGLSCCAAHGRLRPCLARALIAPGRLRLSRSVAYGARPQLQVEGEIVAKDVHKLAPPLAPRADGSATVGQPLTFASSGLRGARICGAP